MLHYDSFHRRDTLMQDDSVQDPIGIPRVPILSLIYYVLSEQLQTMLLERLLCPCKSPMLNLVQYINYVRTALFA